jgi:hypothetical protein
VISPGRIHSVSGDGGVERERQTKKPKQHAKPHTRASFHPASDREHDKECRDENHDRDSSLLRLKQGGKHRL